jgi:hypothetical protein
MYQKAIKYTEKQQSLHTFFHSQALQSIPKLGNFGMKIYPIWQPCVLGGEKLEKPAGLPDFSLDMIPKLEKMHQMNKKCTKCS